MVLEDGFYQVVVGVWGRKGLGLAVWFRVGDFICQARVVAVLQQHTRR